MSKADVLSLIKTVDRPRRVVIISTRDGWESLKRQIPSVDELSGSSTIPVELFDVDSQLTMRLIDIARDGGFDEVVQVFSDRILKVDVKLLSNMLKPYAVDCENDEQP